MRVYSKRAKRMQGTTGVPGDKSISHRALLFSALSENGSLVRNLGPGQDVRSTAECLRRVGVEIVPEGEATRVRGVGLSGLRPPVKELDCGNSGTTMRLLSGVIAGARVGGHLTGDASLSKRPMKRVLEPLRQMGAVAKGQRNERGDEVAPLDIEAGHPLKGVRHELQVASAQVKSCLLLAGLFAEGETTVREPESSRDHTERMLRALGAPLSFGMDGAVAVHRPERPLVAPEELWVPGDPSSAAFLVAAGLIVPGARTELVNVDVNPTRIGFLRVLQRMGADIEVVSSGERAGDPVATLHARGDATLRATDIGAGEVPSLLDELPILAVVASQAQGTTTVSGASELRVKESDRIVQMVKGLRAMGANIEERPDGFVVHGPCALRGAGIDAAGDHRIAMSFAVAGLCADGETQVEGAEWADISYPGFFRLLASWSEDAIRLG
jgi:3-phosphoshikimate 1-carboxyvinyltransferase